MPFCKHKFAHQINGNVMELLFKIVISKSGLLRLIRLYFDEINHIDTYGSKYMIDTKSIVISLMNIAYYDSISHNFIGIEHCCIFNICIFKYLEACIFQFVNEPFEIFLK